jgi:hypothetical protein
MAVVTQGQRRPRKFTWPTGMIIAPISCQPLSGHCSGATRSMIERR